MFFFVILYRFAVVNHLYDGVDCAEQTHTLQGIRSNSCLLKCCTCMVVQNKLRKLVLLCTKLQF
jgi:hypothetical protein